MSEIRPNIPVFNPEWMQDLTFDTTDEPFEVLQPAAHYREWPKQWIDIDALGLEEPLDAFLDRDPYPLPSLVDREGYYDQDRHFDWWLSGLEDFLKVQSCLKEYGAKPLGEDARMLELGCASGRMLRHAFCQGDGCEVWGCDIKLRHIEWMRNFLPTDIKLFQNTVLPNLPLEDKYFDLVCAYSVFTHIDHMELGWIAELRRIVKPGGFALLSIHGDHCWSQLGPDKPVYNSLMSMRKRFVGWKDFSPEIFQKPMPHSKTVFTWSTARNYNCNVFHSTDYIRKAWGRFFDVLDIIPSGHSGYQDVVVLRKPNQ